MSSPFVTQHLEKMYDQQHAEKQIKAEERETAKMVKAPRSDCPQNRLPLLERDEKMRKVQERRQQQEAKLDERKRDIEQQRRQKNIRAAQNYERCRSKAEELERLDDIRRRIEICSYEDQQKYVEEGWKVIQDTKIRQDERQRAMNQRDQHLQSLIDQMNAIDAKMKSRRERCGKGADEGGRPREPTARELANAYKHRVSQDAPWNRERQVPVGFTKESWQAHQRIMAGANPEPRARKPSASPPAEVAEPQAPPSAGHLSETDVSVMLRREQQMVQNDPKFQHEEYLRKAEAERQDAQRLWEEQRQKIRDAKNNDVQKSSPYEKPASALRSTPPAAPPLSNACLFISPSPAIPAPPAKPSPTELAQQHPVSDGDDASDSDSEFDDVLSELRDQKRRPAPPELFEEPNLPPNDVTRVQQTMKFTLDGKTLHLPGASASDPLEDRVAALRLFLNNALGGPRTFEQLHSALRDIQMADVDESLADAMLSKLEEQYGKKSCFVDLMMQLMVCEGMLTQH
jgi:hypothetical protein